MFLDKWVFIGILHDGIQSETNQPLRRACFHPLTFIALSQIVLFLLMASATASDISIYLLLWQTRRDPRGCSNEISNSSWKLGRHWKWIERANNAEQGVHFGEVANRWVASGLGRSLCVSDGRRRGGLKQRGVEAHSDVRTEHDFTALTRDARNAPR